MRRFSYVSTLAFEKYGGILIPCVGLLFGAITDRFNPFFFEFELLYYCINLASVAVGLGVGFAVYAHVVAWMREHTIWSTEWEREHGTCLSSAQKASAFISILKALWHIFIAIVVALVILVLVGLICYAFFKGLT